MQSIDMSLDILTPAEIGPYRRISGQVSTSSGMASPPAFDIEVPEHWSDNAARILSTIYFRKKGVPAEVVIDETAGMPTWLCPRVPKPGTTFGGETSAKQVFNRIAGAITYWGWRYKYFTDEAQAKEYFRHIWLLLQAQKMAPNSPQWFNTGLHWAYGIAGPAQGHYYAAYSADKDEITLDAIEKSLGKINEDINVHPGEFFGKHRITTIASSNAYERPQVHACYIQGVEDTLVNEGGIMDLWSREARIFKFGSGSGTNFSRLRGSNESLSGGGTSSGLLSWLKIGDRAAGAIKSGGSTRRAAKMVIVDIDHPDIEAFIDLKVIEEHKVAALHVGSHALASVLHEIAQHAAADPDATRNLALARAVRTARRLHVPEAMIDKAITIREQADYPVYNAGNWLDEAYQTVTGQNANNTVRVGDDFWAAVTENREWQLVNRTNPSTMKTVSAHGLYDKLVKAAWISADPGMHNKDIINAWNTVANDGEIVASNPCSEYLFLDGTACNLASLNLVAFFDPETGAFDAEGYEAAAAIMLEFLDITNAMAQMPSRSIAETSAKYRTTGLGFANLGALLMILGLPYDSDEARALTAALISLLTAAAYKRSIELAERLNPFPAYDRNKEPMLRVLKMHRDATWGINVSNSPNRTHYALDIQPGTSPITQMTNTLIERARTRWDEITERAPIHGVRNAFTTVIAPTGTISFVMDCDTTGYEPAHSLVTLKQLASGGFMKLPIRSMSTSLKRLGYTPSQIDAIIDYCMGTQTIARSSLAAPLQARGLTSADFESIDHIIHSSVATGQETTASKALRYYLIKTPEAAKRMGIDIARVENETIEDETALLIERNILDEANLVVAGRGVIEGAPHLAPQHLPIFDTATTRNPEGRFIAPIAHVRMLAAGQPFLSGAISKTANLPASATPEDIRELFFTAWKLGVKALAVYRDGSKMAQPLRGMGGIDLAPETDEDNETINAEKVSAWLETEEGKAYSAAAGLIRRSDIGIPRGVQRPLPNPNTAKRLTVTLDGKKIHLTYAEFEDGSLGEFFIQTDRLTSDEHQILGFISILASIGLQYGVPLNAITKHMIGLELKHQGFVTMHTRIKKALSIFDLVARHFAITYLGQEEYAQVSKEEMIANTRPGQLSSYRVTPYHGSRAITRPIQRLGTPNETRNSAHPMQQATGDICQECSNATLVTTGSCKTCRFCGHNSGC